MSYDHDADSIPRALGVMDAERKELDAAVRKALAESGSLTALLERLVPGLTRQQYYALAVAYNALANAQAKERAKEMLVDAFGEAKRSIEKNL
jgi:hypothetical protein